MVGRDKSTATLGKALYMHMGSMNNFQAIGAMYLDPSGKRVIAIGNGVCSEPEIWVYPVSEIERLLREVTPDTVRPQRPSDPPSVAPDGSSR